MTPDETTTAYEEAAAPSDESSFDETEVAAGAATEPAADAQIERLTVERDEYLDALRRLQAEFDNYRKRMTRQQSELIDRAAESLLERLLPALDALDLAAAHAGAEDASAEQLGTAVGQISSLLLGTLAKEGLERIEEVGVGFDPTRHDAVAHEPADGEEGAVVAEVLRPGYVLRGRTLRPAMVRVRG